MKCDKCGIEMKRVGEEWKCRNPRCEKGEKKDGSTKHS